MEITTIRVPRSIRDRLAERAEAHGHSLGAELEAMLVELEWQGIEADYRRLAGRAEALAAYRSEAESILSAGLDDLAVSAAEEYPEYNT